MLHFALSWNMNSCRVGWRLLKAFRSFRNIIWHRQLIVTLTREISHKNPTELQKCSTNFGINGFPTRPAYYNIYHYDLLLLRRNPTSSLLKYLFVAIYFQHFGQTVPWLFAFIKYSKFETWTLLTGSLWWRPPQKNSQQTELPESRSIFGLPSR